MSVLWRRNLDDGTQVCRMDDGSFIFLQDTIVKGNYYALAKLEPVVNPKTLRDKKIEFELWEFDALDRQSLKASLHEDMSTDSMVKFMKTAYKIELTDEIIDDIEATRLARRMFNGK